MPLSKPAQTRIPGRPKRMASFFDNTRLATAADRARYNPSDYHCRLPDGRPRRMRAKPASACERPWAIPDATEALRVAIVKGHVSDVWDDEFPRYAWHLDGEIIYEARHTRGPLGTYHAYPIDEAEAPLGLRS